MFTLSHLNQDGLGFDLARNSDPHSKEDRFTVVIGANGSGKSRLLRAIATSLMNHGEDNSLFATRGPKRILAVSNLVSDSFPFEPRSAIGPYRYLGLRQASNNMSTGSLQDSILDSLLAYELENSDRVTLSPVLRELGFDRWTIVRSSRRGRLPLVSLSDFSRELERYKTERAPSIAREITKVLNAELSSIQERDGDVQFQLISLLRDLRETFDLPSALLIRTIKKASGLTWKVVLNSQHASSPADKLSAGQSMLLSMCARIAANIDRDSVVLVDEPETGLHPNWQSAFIPLLRSMLTSGTGSHFFIATHSPHLVSDASDVLFPSASPGLFEEFDEPFYGRSPENVLYRVFGARVTGNLMVESDLTTVMSALSSPSHRTFAPHSSETIALQRLRTIASSDTFALNSIISEADYQIANSE